MDVIIYHNPACATSRNMLGLIRNAGVEPHVVEYVKTPPTRATLKSLIERMGVPVRAVTRQKDTPFAELGLSNPARRPSETVLALLPPQWGEFRKEDGELVVDAVGQPVRA